MMLQRKSNKIIFYFFLFLIVSSINNFDLNNIKLAKIKNINVSGLDYEDKKKFLKEIKSLELKNIFSFDTLELKKIFAENTLIENYKIFRIYPSTLAIEIQKTSFLAKISSNNKIYLVGTNGKLSNSNISKIKLPFIFGNPDIKNFLKFKKIIDDSKISYNQIKNIYYFQSKRWDLELENNILLKLPKDNIKISLDNSFEFINFNNFLNNKIIDTRIENQIIVNERRSKS
tara:strand:- start:829 stop:1518 length:690 start_codon:yes stop_codon:yes gene_type:complete